jgi:feruloyl esterase
MLRTVASASALLLSLLLSSGLAGPPDPPTVGQSTAASRSPAACTGLASLVIPRGTVTVAETVPTADNSSPISLLAPRAFCRVAATLTPSSDSEIKIEVWMPVTEWNRKLVAVGNGAFSGAIAYAAMRNMLARGYAAASTDTGHEGGSASFALGHPEKLTDFGWRAVHEMTVAAKQIIAAYYESGPRFAYWNGCSAGGRQGMKEAQRFPADYDGIIAGAPGLDWTGRAAQAVRIAKVLDANEAARLPAAARQRLHQGALATCDAADGLADGLISSPDRCVVDPAQLQCRTKGATECLTSAQVATARLIYASPINPQTKRPVPGLLPGSELGWTDLGWTASARATGLDQFRFIVFGDPEWTIRRFDFDRDIVRAEAGDDDTINALNPNLGRFFARGGRLIQYHGWSDPQISPAISPQYYQRAADLYGGIAAIQDRYRLFMAPGMGHCSGGAGPNTFDMLAALEEWVERGRAPDRILATHSTNGVVDRTRPLCPYPEVATYTGKGSIDDAANFVCRAPAGQR